eukprot:TRINITY_DN91257_c0_g1_i1.p1 TRINITY_DN91257_c0_g1~~TRINITY_DN91257_c0_g1_i1.p1  ORF type:complete len:405 (+),score=55.93 TRINITY_DN91257_c0_g1_i1:79-1293(+)
MAMRGAAAFACCLLASLLLLCWIRGSSTVTSPSASHNSEERRLLSEAEPSLGLDPPNRTVQLVVDTTMTHNTIDYNIVAFNCATWVHFLLQGYGIHCDYFGGIVALPDCKCSETYGCSGVGSGSDLIKKYMDVENKTNMSGNPARMTMHVADGGVKESLKDAKNFELEVVRTLIPQMASYHVSVLARWLEDSKWKMISFSGWPYDTIQSWDTLKDLFTGHFTVAFPDPTMRRAFQQDQTKNLKVMASLNDTMEPVQLPSSSTDIEGFTVVKRHPHFDKMHLLLVKLQGQDEPLSFIEVVNPAKFLELLNWHIVSPVYDEDLNKWVYNDLGHSLASLPLETAIVQYEDRYFMQRPLISQWFHTLFAVLLDRAQWTPSVRPSNNTDTAEIISVTPDTIHSSVIELV